MSPENIEYPQEGGSVLRRELKREVLLRLQEVVKEDSDAYEYASVAVGAFLARTLDVVDLMEEELKRDSTLPEGAEGKLPPEERGMYEDFVLEAEASAVILPSLMQQVRVVQYDPNVQERLKEVVKIVIKKDQLLEVFSHPTMSLKAMPRSTGEPE